jgi:hypothetical protein
VIIRVQRWFGNCRIEARHSSRHISRPNKLLDWLKEAWVNMVAHFHAGVPQTRKTEPHPSASSVQGSYDALPDLASLPIRLCSFPSSPPSSSSTTATMFGFSPLLLLSFCDAALSFNVELEGPWKRTVNP